MSSGPIELASTVVSIGISTKDAGKQILKDTAGIGAAFGKVGQQGGSAFSSAFSKSSAGATKAAVADQAALEKAVQSAVGKVKTARDAEAAAARKVAIEETKLKEARGSGAKESQILAIEDRLANARTKQALATSKTTVEVDKLKGAQRELKSATEQAEQGVTKSAGRLRTAFDKINPFAGMKAKAKKEGEDAGDEFGSSMEQAAKKGQGRLGKAGVAIGTAVGGGLLQVANKVGGAFVDTVTGSISGASNLEQSIGGIGAVFGKDVDQIDKAARGAATSIGMSRNAYNELATTVGAGLKNKGIKDYAGETQRLLGLGGDLAAQFGGSTQEAVEALSSLMRGESDPIERYGVSINETAVNAELAARGQDKLTGAALESAKAQARLDLVFRQTADAQGAFARESNTFAGVQARASAQWEDLQAKIGTAFLPALTQAMGFISNTALPALEAFGGWISRVWRGEGEGTSWFSTLAAQVAPVVEAFQRLAGVYAAQLMPVLQSVGSLFSTVIMPALASLWQSIQANVVPAFTVLVGKVGEVVQVIGSILGPIIQTIVAKFQELSPQINAAMTQLGQIVGGVMELISTLVGAALDVIRKLWSLWGDNILSLVRIVMDTIIGVIRGVMNIIQGVINVVMGVITGDWSRAWGGIKQIFEGIWQVIVSLLSGVLKVIVEVIKAAWDVVKALFVALGQFLAGLWEGLWNGIKNFLVTTTQAIWTAIQGWWANVKAGFSAFGAFVSGLWTGLWTGISTFLSTTTAAIWTAIQSWWTNVRTGFSAFVGTVSGLWSGLWNGLKAVGDSVMASIKGAIDLGLNAVKGFFSSAVEGIRTIWDGLKKAASDPVRFVIDTIINNGIIKGWNDLVGLLQLNNLKIAPISVPGFWRGGVLPGPGTSAGDDMVVMDRHGVPRATVASGEPVISREAYARNKPIIDNIIRGGSGLPAYFQGGTLPTPGPVRPHGLPYYGARYAADMGLGAGSPVYAWRDGTVSQVMYANTSYGNRIRANHGDSGQTLYAHLSRILVSVGQAVKAGQKIGEVGYSGNVRPPGPGGAHLHFEILGGNAPVNASAQGSAEGDGAGLFDMAGKWITDKVAAPVRALFDKIPGAGLFLDLAKAVGSKLLDAAIGKLKSLIPGVGDDSSLSGSSAGSGWQGNANLLMQAGKALGASRQAMKIALMTAAQESSLGTNKTAMGRINGDGDVGWFQQRATRGDGTVAQLADPLYGLRVFLQGKRVPAGYHVPGLYNIRGWEGMGLGNAAQRVQVSAFPRAYDKWEDEAEAWLRNFGYWRGTDSATPGWHLVGERGPELVNFRGGEQVLSNTDSAAALAGQFPRELVVVDADGALVGRMRVEAQSALADSYARVGGR